MVLLQKLQQWLDFMTNAYVHITTSDITGISGLIVLSIIDVL